MFQKINTTNGREMWKLKTSKLFHPLGRCMSSFFPWTVLGYYPPIYSSYRLNRFMYEIFTNSRPVRFADPQQTTEKLFSTGNRHAIFPADPCFYNGTCTNTAGSYQCGCTSSKTGKKCELEKAACDSKPCNGTDICALSERSPRGFQCVNKQLETTMVLVEDKYSSVYDVEKAIENLIKTAPSNSNMVR